MMLPSSAQNGKYPAEPFHFEGFSEPAYTMIPDVFFDMIAPKLSEAELRVLLYIFRRTFGFKKQTDNISLKQMVEGIRTKDGRVLDHGAGVAKSTAWRGIKGLVAKGMIESRRNASKAHGDEATTYTLHFRDTVFQNETPPVSLENTRRVSLRNTQETVKQNIERQGENSNDTDSGKNVDNDGDNTRRTPYLDQVISDFSKEFGDTVHDHSNRKQAKNILCELDIKEDDFVERFVYPARAKTRHGTGIEKRMPYFFQVLRDLTHADEPTAQPIGYEDAHMEYGFGHGPCCLLVERPSLRRAETTDVLEPGRIFAFEPMFVVEGQGTAVVEETVPVTASAYRPHARGGLNHRQVSTTDLDAVAMKTSGQKATLGFHDHYVIDGGKARIILNALVTPADVMENTAMLPPATRDVPLAGEAEAVIADMMYGTASNIRESEERGIRAYGPLPDWDQCTPYYGPARLPLSFVQGPEIAKKRLPRDADRCADPLALHRPRI